MSNYKITLVQDGETYWLQQGQVIYIFDGLHGVLTPGRNWYFLPADEGAEDSAAILTEEQKNEAIKQFPAYVPVETSITSGVVMAAGSGFINTGDTDIIGDIAPYPIATTSGFDTVELDGSVLEGSDASLQHDAALTSYNTIQALEGATTIDEELGGVTLTPGTYKSASGNFKVTGTLTLNPGGSIDGYDFQMTGNLTLMNGAKIVMVGTPNVSFAAEGHVSIGTNAIIGASTIISLGNINIKSGAEINGYIASYNGSITMNNATVTQYS